MTKTLFASAAALALLAGCGEPVSDTDTATTTTTTTTAPDPMATDTAATTTTGGMTPAADPAAGTAAVTIVAVAQGNPDFSTLVSAVTAADLGGTLSGAGPFTVFAPTNAAFAKVDKATLDGLMTPAKKADLVKLLTYHVVPGRVLAADLTKKITDGGGKAELTTVNGAKLTAALEGGKVVLTDAKGGKATVATADVAASNGVIHAIDTVVMP